MASSGIPIAAIQSFHAVERRLYARMALELCMDPARSMEIIAFWLWMEENGHPDIIRRISALDDAQLRAVAAVAQGFVRAIRLDLPADEPAGPGIHQPFRHRAIGGITSFLRSVCHTALADIRRAAEEAGNLRRMEELVRQLSLAHVRAPAVDLPGGPEFVPYGEGPSRGGGARRANTALSPSIFDVERAIRGVDPFNLMGAGAAHSLQTGPALQHFLAGRPNARSLPPPPPPPLPRPDVQTSLLRPSLLPPQEVPRDERTLFVTFSNGYPFTEEELYTFFMSHFGDVEAINIQQTKGGRPPLFAHVSFRSLETVLRILDGHVKVKFVAQGKHLWARRYIPQRNQNSDE